MNPKHIEEAHRTMGKIKDCYMFLMSANNAGIEEIARVFGIASGQLFPPDIIKEFKALGKQNLDFLTSDFLIQKGYKNLLSA